MSERLYNCDKNECLVILDSSHDLHIDLETPLISSYNNRNPSSPLVSSPPHTPSPLSSSTSLSSSLNKSVIAFHLHELKDALTDFLSSNPAKHKSAEILIERNRNNSKLLFLLISYACLGNSTADYVVEYPVVESPTEPAYHHQFSSHSVSSSPLSSSTVSSSSSPASTPAFAPTHIPPLPSSDNIHQVSAGLSRLSLWSQKDTNADGPVPCSHRVCGGKVFIDELQDEQNDHHHPIHISSAAAASDASTCISERSLSAVIAKRFIQSQWVNNNSTETSTITGAATANRSAFSTSCLTEYEKSEIKEILLEHLIDLPPTIRPTIHLIVAFIAFNEGLPNGWPSLIPTLVYHLDQCRHQYLQATDGLTMSSLTSGGSVVKRTASAATGILDLLLIMSNPDNPSESLAKELLNPNHGLQEGILFLAQGMKQLNIARKKEVKNKRDLK